MTSELLIKALRYCGNFEDREGCDEECPYFNDKDCPNRIMCDAADALEADEQRIKELESQAAFFDAEKLNYQENIEYRDERIKELEAQIPKEGEWIMDCLAPQMDAHRIGQWAYAPKCSECGTHWDAKTNYCPNCGCVMRTVTDCHTSGGGRRTMSKLIVEMEMPKACPCDLIGVGYAMWCSAASGIPKRVAEYDECVKNGTRPDWCPIIGVLPEEHGDLIDRDVLLETCIYYDINPNKSAVDADNIQDMPVIIAAERKDDEQIH